MLSKLSDQIKAIFGEDNIGDTLGLDNNRPQEFIERRRAIKPTGSEKPPERRKHIPLEESMVELNKACEESKKAREYFND